MKLTTSILTIAMGVMVSTAPIPQDAAAVLGIDVNTSQDGRVDWISTDDKNRDVYCTPSVPHPAIPVLSLPAGQTVTTYFPEGWIGNCHGVIEGQENMGTGMLAEFCFNAWQDLTYFDVSAIVVPDDSDNVYAIVPMDGESPMSGCWDGVAPGMCDHNVYVLPDDVQTKATSQNQLQVYLGPNGSGGSNSSLIAQRAMQPLGEAVARTFVLNGRQ